MLPRCAQVLVLKSELVGNAEAEARLVRKACILELLRHGGIPRVFECGLLGRRPWIAIEYIDGSSLEQVGADPLAVADALTVIRDAAAILAHAHSRGVVHRNLTPASIVRTPARDVSVCITGWRHASIDGRGGQPIVEPGSRFYGAPELVDGAGGGAADVFALGAIMFEATTLVLPEPVQKFPGIPEPLHQLLANMLAPDPEHRPTAAAVHVEATRLVELFSDGGAAIEEVEVELVDIASGVPAMPNLGWMPPEHIAGMKGQPLGSVRRRRDP